MPTETLPLAGLRVFLVEDEALVAMQLEDMLRRNGLPQKVVHIMELLAPYYAPIETAKRS